MDLQKDAAWKEKNMRILHIAYLDGDPFSGVCVVVPQHIRAQQELGHETAIYNVDNVRIDGVNCQIDDIGDFKDPDIVIFQECYRKEYLKIVKEFRAKGIPYVVIPHGELSDEAQKKKHLKKVAANLLLFNRFTDNAAAIQCLSQREFDTTHFGKKKFIATNGVYIPGIRKESFNKDKTNIVYIGRLDAFHKGLDILIDAAKINHDRLISSNTVINVYGPDFEGRLAHLLELVGEADVSDVVKLHDPVTGDKKISILLDADFFIQTSRFEGMPLGILEALSYGIPCLVTRGTTLGEKIEGAGCGLMAETEPVSVAEKIMQMIEGRDRFSEMSDNGIKFVEENFSWNVVAQEAVRNYSELLR